MTKRKLNMHPLAVRRRKFGWTQHQLAVKVGLRQPHIARIELGTEPRLELAKQLARVLETGVEDLF